MPAGAKGIRVNRLVERIAHGERQAFRRRCEEVDVVDGEILCRPQERFRHAHFPLSGVVCVAAVPDGRSPLALGLVGCEGMLGATMTLGVDAAPWLGRAVGPVRALRLSSQQLERELRDSRSLRAVLAGYLYLVTAQLAQDVACVSVHDLPARLARWLLLMADRTGSERFHLTHQTLADMLGVQRSGITIASGALKRGRIVRYVRGEIVLLDRRRLEALSCSCHAAGVALAARIVG